MLSRLRAMLSGRAAPVILDSSRWHVIRPGLDVRMGVRHWDPVAQCEITLDRWPSWEPVLGRYPEPGNPFDYDWWEACTLSTARKRIALRAGYGESILRVRQAYDPSVWDMLELNDPRD